MATRFSHGSLEISISLDKSSSTCEFALAALPLRCAGRGGSLRRRRLARHKKYGKKTCPAPLRHPTEPADAGLRSRSAGSGPAEPVLIGVRRTLVGLLCLEVVP